MAQMNPPTTAIDFRKRRVQHKWCKEERIILCLMKRFFDLSNRDITKIFNSLYEAKVRNEGFPDGLPRSTVNTQYEDIKRKRHCDFDLVYHEVSFSQGPTHFAPLLEKIRSAARKLHIGLVARARDLEITAQERATNSERRPRISVTMPAPRQERRVMSNAPQTSSASRLSSNNRQLQAPAAPVMSAVPTMPAETSDVAESIAHIRSYTLKNSQPPIRPKNVPTLLFRFSNESSMGINHKSGYIASAFINDIGSIPSPEERAAEFPTWLEIHVRPRRIPSPFISTSTDPLVPIHRALTQGKDSFVSLIDSTQIRSDHIFYMNDLMKQYNICTPGYRGAKEYIVWGTIGRGAIVMSFKADQLVAIANEHPDIKNALRLDLISASANCKSQLYKKIANRGFESDLVAGKIVGKLLRLLNLHQEYLDDVALALNGSWSFTASEDCAEFLRGAREGYEKAAPSSLQVALQTPYFESQASAPEPSNFDPDDQDTHDYVIVNRPETDHTQLDAQLRQSVDRLSIHDNEETPLQKSNRVISHSPSVTARTVATRRISIFDERSESWVMVPDSQLSTTLRDQALRSIENGQTDVQSPMLEQEEEQPTFKTPTTSPKVKRARSESTDSESTLAPSTPASRFSRERSHVNRVLGVDWASFWDSMQNDAE